MSTGRCDVLKSTMGAANRKTKRFRVLVSAGVGEEAEEAYLFSEALVDATGTFGNYNHSGAGGIPAIGERAAGNTNLIIRVVPDPLGADRERFSQANKITVLGSGYSAITTLNALATLRSDLLEGGYPAPELVWLTRRDGQPFDLIENDPLPQRSLLAQQGNNWAQGDGAASGVQWVGGVQLVQISTGSGSLQLTLEVAGPRPGESTIQTDFLVSNCGYRPDSELYQELQMHQCYATEGPMNLAAAMMPSSGGSADCLKQVAPGAATLLNPEPGFLILGMKSYGRGSRFIMKIGHEQVEHAMTLLPESLS